MNKLVQLFLTIATLYFLFLSQIALGQNYDLIRKQASLLKVALEDNHYNPKSYDSAFCSTVVTKLIDYLDPHHLFFLQSDIDEIRKHQNTIAGDMNGDSWNFMPMVAELYKSRLLKYQKGYFY
ncbi:MAG: hypothetical protein ACK4ND_13735 [Cytophagaceae bacterium]